MKQYPFPDSRHAKILFVLFLLGLLLLARDTLITTCLLGFYRSQLLLLGLMLAAGGAFLIRNRHRLKEIVTDSRMLLAAVGCGAILLPMLVKRDWQMMYFSVLLCVLFGVFVSYFTDVSRVSRVYVLVLTGLSLYSLLVAFVLRPLTDGGVLSVPVFYNSNDIDFYNYGLGFSSVKFVKNRNFGIFREPGVYQYFLLLAIFLNNYTVKWEKNLRMWLVNGILALTMLSTFATGGVIELGLLAIVMFFDKKWYRDRKIRTGAIVLALALSAAAAGILLQGGALSRELTAMVTKFVTNPESTGARMNSILVDTALFFRHPLFGGGLADILHVIRDNTTSTMLMFSIFGILGGCLHVAGWVALVWSRERKIWANLAILVILFMSFNTQNLIADVFFWLLPMMALAEKGIPFVYRRTMVQKG